MKNTQPKGRKVPPPVKTNEGMTPQDMLVFEIDRALTLLVDTCEITSKKLAGDFVPIDMMKTFKETIIRNYKEGLKQNPNFK